MTLAAALTRLNTWAVTGVTTHYGIDDLPGQIPEAALPALVTLFSEYGQEGGKPFDMALSTAYVTVWIDHLLLLSGGGLKIPAVRLSGVPALIDNYISKVKADWTLNDTLLEPLTIQSVTVGSVLVANWVYYGVVFKHRWILAI